jgi:hypothetical protein
MWGYFITKGGAIKALFTAGYHNAGQTGVISMKKAL